MIKISNNEFEIFVEYYDPFTKVISDKKRIFLSDYKIQDILCFNTLDRIVILYHADFYKVDNENVICIDYKGNLQWKSPHYEYYSEGRSNPIVSIAQIDAKLVRIYHWDSHYKILKPLTGEVVITPDESMYGRRPW